MASANDLDTRQRILALALDLMTSQGFEKTTIGELADGMGFSKAAIYYHFNAKDEILTALVEPYLDRLGALIDEVPGSTHSPAGRKEMLGAYLELLLDYRPLVLFLNRDVSVLHHPAVEGRFEELTRRLRARLAGPRGGRAAEIRAAAALGVLMRPVLDFPDLDLDEFKEMLLVAAVGVTRSRLPRRNRQASG